MRFLAAVASVAVLAASCNVGEQKEWVAVAGRDFDMNRVSVIQKGVTTKDDIVQLFGHPYRMKGDKESEAWEYYVKFGREYVTVTYLIVPTRRRDTLVRKFTVQFDGDYVSEYEAKVEEF